MSDQPAKYYIGQRVIIQDCEIGAIQHVAGKHRDGYIHVYTPSAGFARAYPLSDIKPLPNGQL